MGGKAEEVGGVGDWFECGVKVEGAVWEGGGIEA